MKVLRLALSHDLRADIPEEGRQYVIAQRVLEEATGETWETAVRPIWPSEKLPGLVAGWIEEEQPDLVLVCMAGYWPLFGSVALRLERRVPLVGHFAARAARRTAETRVAANHRLTEVVRSFATRLIGVDYYFEPPELLERFDGIFRQLCRDEALVVAVRGPGPSPQSVPPRIQRERARRYRAWREGVEQICERLHIVHLPFAEEPAGTRLPGDPSHYTAEGTLTHGLREGQLMVRAWERTHGGPAGSPS